MNKVLAGLAIVLVVIAAFFGIRWLNYDTVRPDEEAVIVDLYGKREIQLVSQPGRYHVGWGKELYTFPVRLERIEWKGDDSIKFQSKDSMSITGEAVFQMAIERGASVDLVRKYGSQAAAMISKTANDAVREAVTNTSTKYTAIEINGPLRSKFAEDINKTVREQLAKEHIRVENFIFTGQFILPAEVKKSIDASQQAIQISIQRENEVRTQRAQAQKDRIIADTKAYAVITAAKAESEANRLRQSTVTDRLIQYQFALAWDGKLPTSYVNTGSNTGNLIQVPVPSTAPKAK